jgi:hypothetical protein
MPTVFIYFISFYDGSSLQSAPAYQRTLGSCTARSQRIFLSRYDKHATKEGELQLNPAQTHKQIMVKHARASSALGATKQQTLLDGLGLGLGAWGCLSFCFACNCVCRRLGLDFFVLFMGVFMDAAASPSAAATASGFGGPPAIASIRSTILSGFFSSPHAAASTSAA